MSFNTPPRALIPHPLPQRPSPRLRSSSFSSHTGSWITKRSANGHLFCQVNGKILLETLVKNNLWTRKLKFINILYKVSIVLYSRNKVKLLTSYWTGLTYWLLLQNFSPDEISRNTVNLQLYTIWNNKNHQCLFSLPLNQNWNTLLKGRLVAWQVKYVLFSKWDE